MTMQEIKKKQAGPEPTDEEVMRVTKGVIACGPDGCGGPMTMERRRGIYRIIMESGTMDKEKE